MNTKYLHFIFQNVPYVAKLEMDNQNYNIIDINPFLYRYEVNKEINEISTSFPLGEFDKIDKKSIDTQKYIWSPIDKEEFERNTATNEDYQTDNIDFTLCITIKKGYIESLTIDHNGVSLVYTEHKDYFITVFDNPIVFNINKDYNIFYNKDMIYNPILFLNDLVKDKDARVFLGNMLTDIGSVITKMGITSEYNETDSEIDLVDLYGEFISVFSELSQNIDPLKFKFFD